MDTADAIPVEKGVNILTHITQLYSARAQVAAHIASASLKEPSAGDYAWLYQVLHTHTHTHTALAHKPSISPPPPTPAATSSCSILFILSLRSRQLRSWFFDPCPSLQHLYKTLVFCIKVRCVWLRQCHSLPSQTCADSIRGLASCKRKLQ
jgi:hypothetical protein